MKPLPLFTPNIFILADITPDYVVLICIKHYTLTDWVWG